MTNPYESPLITSRAPRTRVKRWYSCLWPIVGSIFGIAILAILTTGARATWLMTVNNPRETAIFFIIFSLAILFTFAFWKTIRTIVTPSIDASPFLRIGCGFTSILMFLPGIYVLRQVGILNMNGFSQALNWFTIITHGMLSIAIPVEIEQYLARRFSASRLDSKTKAANNPMDRSGGSAAS